MNDEVIIKLLVLFGSGRTGREGDFSGTCLIHYQTRSTQKTKEPILLTSSLLNTATMVPTYNLHTTYTTHRFNFTWFSFVLITTMHYVLIHHTYTATHSEVGVFFFLSVNGIHRSCSHTNITPLHISHCVNTKKNDFSS